MYQTGEVKTDGGSVMAKVKNRFKGKVIVSGDYEILQR